MQMREPRTPGVYPHSKTMPVIAQRAANIRAVDQIGL